MKKREKQRGFSLVEIMLVLGVIGIIIAVAVPNLIRANINANEMTAKANLKIVRSACASYYGNQTPKAYPDSLASLGSANPPYIDSNLASGQKQGYTYSYLPSGSPPDGWSCVATPSRLNVSGINSYFVDQTGVIRRGTSAIGTPVE